MGQPIPPAPNTGGAPANDPNPATLPTNPPAPPATPPAAPEKQFSQADLDRIIGERLARTNAELATAKVKAEQWDAFEHAAKPEDERKAAEATKAAEAAGFAKARDQFGAQLVEANIVAAAAGRLSDQQRQALLLGLDRKRFLKEDGSVDGDAVKTLIDGLAPAVAPEPQPGFGQPPIPGGFGQGARPGTPASGISAGAAAYEAKKAAKGTEPLFS